jgi:hypothetical protein
MSQRAALSQSVTPPLPPPSTPPAPRRAPKRRPVNWLLIVGVVLCCVMTLSVLSTVSHKRSVRGSNDDVDGGEEDVDEGGEEDSDEGGFGRASQEAADKGIAAPRNAWDSDLEPENEADALMAGQGQAASDRVAPVRSRAWAVVQGKPLAPIESWRFPGRDPGCVVKLIASPTAEDAALLPPDWETFRTSGRAIVFPRPGQRVEVAASAGGGGAWWGWELGTGRAGASEHGSACTNGFTCAP